MKDMAGKVAIVTGGASGMGQIIARRLVTQGARVAIFDVNDQGLQAMAAEADTITALRCDISNREEVEARVAEVAQNLGPIDLLVHCAALMPSHKLIDHTHEGMERLFRINYFGTTYMVRAVLPAMMARKSGRIIAFGSIAGIALVPKMGAYCATKAAVNAYMEVLQNEIRDSGVRAHLVCPPAVNTRADRPDHRHRHPGQHYRGAQKRASGGPGENGHRHREGRGEGPGHHLSGRGQAALSLARPVAKPVVEDGDALREVTSATRLEGTLCLGGPWTSIVAPWHK